MLSLYCLLKPRADGAALIFIEILKDICRYVLSVKDIIIIIAVRSSTALENV